MITPLPFGEGKGEGPLTYRGISVITPLPFGEGTGEGPPGKGEEPALQLDTNSEGVKAENNN